MLYYLVIQNLYYYSSFYIYIILYITPVINVLSSIYG